MRKEDLRIVFMGTPSFAVPTLEALLQEGYNVAAVVTQPDRPVGRHGSLPQPPAVKSFALKNGLPVLQPEKMRDPLFIRQLQAYNANLQIVVAFRMLPEVVWTMPQYGTFNVHASLLPQYRGAAPINWAIINGETETGITTFFLDKQIDTGRIIMQRKMDIPDNYDAADLHDALMTMGAKACIDTVERIISANGHPEATPQETLYTGSATLHQAPKIFKDTCRIDWTEPAKNVYNFIRGLSPTPGAWTSLASPDGKSTVLKVFKTQMASRAPMPAGTLSVDDHRLFIATGDNGCLEILSLQAAGKRRMSAADFLNGNRKVDGLCACQ